MLLQVQGHARLAQGDEGGFHGMSLRKLFSHQAAETLPLSLSKGALDHVLHVHGSGTLA